VVGLVVAVVLVVQGGGGATAGGGGGGGGGGQKSPATSTATQGSPEPSDSPSETPSETPPGDPPGANWFHSPEVGVGFNLPEGWTAQVDGELIVIVEPGGVIVGAVAHDPNITVADVQADPLPYAQEFADGNGSALDGLAEPDDMDWLEAPLDWWEQSFWLDGEAGSEMWLWYIADDPDGGDWQLVLAQTSEVELSEVLDGRFPILKSLTPDGL
jgi:hypothetical protein